jgi:hypothetical protein
MLAKRHREEAWVKSRAGPQLKRDGAAGEVSDALPLFAITKN